MPLDLPEPDRRELARAQLPLVVCVIRFEPLPLATDPRTAIALHERLGGKSGSFPRTEPLQNITFTPGSAGGPIAATTGWRFLSEARDWTATVQSEQASLETTSYGRWGDFQAKLFDLIDAVTERLAPASVLRIGLRYSNRFTDPQVGDPQEWRRYLAPELMGLVLHDRLGAGVLAAQQQVDFDADADVNSTLRHGFYRDDQAQGRLTYVLDFDSYQEGFREWDPDGLKETATRLNDLTLRLFQQVVTADLLAYLRGEDGDGSDS